MAEIRIKVDGTWYKVHDDGDVFKVVEGFFGGESTLPAGRIPRDTP